MTLVERSVNITPRKLGPKKKPLSHRKYTPPKPLQRRENTYSPRKKVEVLMFLEHHRIYDPDHYFSINGYRHPLAREAAVQFLIPEFTIYRWKRDKEAILDIKKRRYSPHWPDLEDELFRRFLEARDKKLIVTTGWFRRQAQIIWEDKYPQSVKVFTFSNGWWLGFKRRRGIVKRRITKESSRRPEEYKAITNNFLRFIRRVSNNTNTLQLRHDQSPKMTINYILDSPVRRFEKKWTLNVDETPIPFEYLDGSTWELRGAKTVAGKTDRSGWSKRQATLIIYIFADGSFRLKPKIIFHGTAGPKGRIFADEGHLYAPDVTVAYNETAYNNEDLFYDWIKDELADVQAKTRDFLLVMDVATFHKTDKVTDQLRQQKVTRALIPPGCTGQLQPLDVSVNRPLKDLLREETLIYMMNKEAQGQTEWSVKDKRIMTTWVVSRAIQRLAQRPEMIAKSFTTCGISVRPDGSQDHLIHIKDIDEIDFTGWETAEEVIVKEEEVVNTLTDFEELILAGDEDNTPEDLYIGLMQLKKEQLKTMAKGLGLLVGGNKDDIVRRLMRKYTDGTTAEAPITVEEEPESCIVVVP
ncbi:hypothetical protein NCS52_01563600 [Fusarium sp. LHS14.1]|nr:hypothetical protein NCS52_01563600 [Fusarium sp. LHS14.1]